MVEEVGALWAMERASSFRGRYHVLGGLLSALDGVGPESLRSPAWCTRGRRRRARGDPGPPAPRSTARPPPTTWPTGWATQRPGDHAGPGVPVGGELDWLDDGTLATALKARRAL